MKFLLLAFVVGVAAADVSHILPSHPNTEKEATILKQEQDISPEGEYQWQFETSNGILAQEQGSSKQIDADTIAKVAQGQASWTSPEGEKIELVYQADENGYQAQGSHIPTSPPIPEAILRALKYIQDHPPQIAPEDAKLIKK